MQYSVVLCQERVLNHDLNGKQMWKNRECGCDDGREGFSKVFVCNFEVLLKPLIMSNGTMYGETNICGF
jgi:hypothetical protein